MTGPVPKPHIMAIAPYIPGRATTDDGRKVAKLSSNENPLGTSDAARAAFTAHAANLERYPDASAADLREAIAAQIPEPNAMTLATVAGDLRPSTRVVLIKGCDDALLRCIDPLVGTRRCTLPPARSRGRATR